MFFLILSCIDCFPYSGFIINEFNVNNYISYRDNLPKNNFLITLSVNNTQKLYFYKRFFSDIINDIEKYIQNRININYIILIDPNLNVNFESTFYLYFPGMSEMEVSIYPRLSIAFNSNKIINNCLILVQELQRLEKEQKSPEISRIKGELRVIAKILKSATISPTKRKNLLKDHWQLSDELMQYIPESKQKERRLWLELQITQEKSSQYKKLEKEIKNEREKLDKLNENEIDLSPDKICRLREKKIIQILKEASDNCSGSVFSSAFVGMFNWIKYETLHIFNLGKNHVDPY